MTPSNEIARLTRDNDRLAAQVESQRAEIERLTTLSEDLERNRKEWLTLAARNSWTIREYSNRLKDMEMFCDVASKEALKVEGKMSKQCDRTRKARRQRDAYRSWADQLAEWLSSYNEDDRIFMDYCRWRGDQP